MDTINAAMLATDSGAEYPIIAVRINTDNTVGVLAVPHEYYTDDEFAAVVNSALVVMIADAWAASVDDVVHRGFGVAPLTDRGVDGPARLVWSHGPYRASALPAALRAEAIANTVGQSLAETWDVFTDTNTVPVHGSFWVGRHESAEGVQLAPVDAEDYAAILAATGATPTVIDPTEAIVTVMVASPPPVFYVPADDAPFVVDGAVVVDDEGDITDADVDAFLADLFGDDDDVPSDDDVTLLPDGTVVDADGVAVFAVPTDVYPDLYDDEGDDDYV